MRALLIHFPAWLVGYGLSQDFSDDWWHQRAEFSFFFLAVEERYSFDLKSIHCCCTVGITNVIIQLRNITQYSLGRRNRYQKVQINCCSVVTARNLIKYKSSEKWGMCENVFLLGVTSQGQQAHWIFPAGMKLRSSRLFVSTSFFPLSL